MYIPLPWLPKIGLAIAFSNSASVFRATSNSDVTTVRGMGKCACLKSKKEKNLFAAFWIAEDEFKTGMFVVSNCRSRSNLNEICSREKLMPTSRTRIASRFNSLKSVSKTEKSEVEIKAVKVESVIGMAFAPRLQMFVRNALAVQSSGSVRTMAIFAAFGLWFGLCIFGFCYSFFMSR